MNNSPGLRQTFEEIMDDPTASVYNVMTGQFLKAGETNINDADADLDAETVSLDNVNHIRLWNEIAASRERMATTVE